MNAKFKDESLIVNKDRFKLSLVIYFFRISKATLTELFIFYLFFDLGNFSVDANSVMDIHRYLHILQE